MLIKIQNMAALPFGALKQIYLDSNMKNANRDYPGRPDGLLQAEMDLYDYLRSVFFKTHGAYYCLWEEQGNLVSALRLEPYRDGVLLTGLETAPDCRGRGFAKKLMAAAAEQEHRPIYSHIERKNTASIAVHQKCGFEKVTNFAVFLDGSVSQKADTYLRKFVNN